MEHLSLSRSATICTAIAMLAGCAGANPATAVPPVASNFEKGSHQKTFRYTGDRQSFIVPNGVKKLSILARGGMGAGPEGGGRVGRVSATIPVKPGQELYIYVGGAAKTNNGGFNGGGDGGASNCHCNGFGGGGASDVRSGGSAVEDRLLVAGGGGGNGGSGTKQGDAGGRGGGGGGTKALP